MTKGDIVYWARILPNYDYNEVIELKIRTVTDTWFVGTDKHTKQAYLFDNDSPYIFKNRSDAVNYSKEYKWED